MGKFGSVRMSIALDFDLDDYADGNDWEREALVDMVKRVFVDDVSDMVTNGIVYEWIEVEGEQ